MKFSPTGRCGQSYTINTNAESLFYEPVTSEFFGNMSLYEASKSPKLYISQSFHQDLIVMHPAH